MNLTSILLYLALAIVAVAGMSFASAHNVGAYAKVLRAFANTAMVAAGSNDNTLITGVVIDRGAYGNPQSAIVGISFSAVLAEAATLTLKSVLVEHGDAANLSDAATYATLADATGVVIATGGTGGTTEAACKEFDVDLAGAKRYIRIKVTPDLSAANTDTAAISGVVVAGGGDTLPV